MTVDSVVDGVVDVFVLTVHAPSRPKTSLLFKASGVATQDR